MTFHRALAGVLAPIAAFGALGACGDGGGFPDAKEPDAAVAGGTMSLAWSLTDLNGAAIACDDVDAQAVTLLLHNKDAEGGSTELFTCKSAMGTTPVIPVGTYDVKFELLHTALGQISQAPPQADIVVNSSENTALQPITFAVDPTGGLDLGLNANKAGGNCGPTAQGGAGIQNMTITLNRTSDGACEPVTFMVSGTPATTYTVNCGTPQVTPCIEADRRLTVSGVRSDAYKIHVRGKIGGVDCYTNDDSLTVPPATKVLTRDLNLGYRMGTPGC